MFISRCIYKLENNIPVNIQKRISINEFILTRQGCKSILSTCFFDTTYTFSRVERKKLNKGRVLRLSVDCYQLTLNENIYTSCSLISKLSQPCLCALVDRIT